MPAMDEARNYTRGYLPHRSVPGATQFLTWRLQDALDPRDWIEWKATYDRADLYRRADLALDEHRGQALLRPPHVGRIVMETLFASHGTTYQVRAAVVMPNHVHAVLAIEPKVELGDVMHAIKGASARRVNEILGRRGRLWQPDYFDRLVRNDDHLRRCVGYIHWNPVKAKLCDDPKHWANSTANPHYAEGLTPEQDLQDIHGPEASASPD